MNDATEGLVAAKQSFRLGTQLVQQGNVYPADDQVVVGREHLFEPVQNRVRTTASISRPVVSPPAEEPDRDQDGDAGRPAGNASREKWAEYVTSLGGDVDEAAGRDELIELANGLEGGD